MGRLSLDSYSPKAFAVIAKVAVGLWDSAATQSEEKLSVSAEININENSPRLSPINAVDLPVLGVLLSSKAAPRSLKGLTSP